MKNIVQKTIVPLVSFFLACNAHTAEELRLNEGLPVMVDSKTELNDILLKNMTVIYTYQLKDIGVDDAKKLKHENKSFIEHHACNDKQIQCLFSKDLDVKFVYKIEDEEILNVNLNKNMCTKLNNNEEYTDIT